MKQFFFVVLLFLLFFSPFTLHALRLPLSVSAQSPTSIPAVTPITPVDYALPYPGLLPDNPLYTLKMLRDKIIGFLISDPLKRAQFDLLQSDKRIGGADGLLRQSPQDEQLIGDTVSKADNYFAQGIEQLHLSKKQGLDITNETNQFFLSNQKHLGVIAQMEKTAGSILKPVLLKEEERMRVFSKEVQADIPQK